MNQHNQKFDTVATRFIKWIGSPSSILFHTIVFLIFFVSLLFGTSVNGVLLVLTTAVSLEAIYLAIFIQMTVNNQAKSIKEVEEDIDEIQEDIDEIQDDVGEISTDINEHHEGVEEVEDAAATIERIHTDLKRLVEDIAKLKSQSEKNP